MIPVYAVYFPTLSKTLANEAANIDGRYAISYAPMVGGRPQDHIPDSTLARRTGLLSGGDLNGSTQHFSL